MPMGVPPHLGHMPLPGQPMPSFPSFRHSPTGPPGAHGPLQGPRPPRGGPLPHGYGGAGGAMGPAGMPVPQVGWHVVFSCRGG